MPTSNLTWMSVRSPCAVTFCTLNVQNHSSLELTMRPQDLSSLFTWNTKQVFVYITATYPSPSPSHQSPSKAIIWDAILPHPLSPTHHNQYTYLQRKPTKSPKSKSKSTSKPPELQPNTPGILQLTSQRPKYQITDPTGRIASRTNATLELAWNVQPWVGALTWATAGPGISRGSFWRTWRGIRGGTSEDFAFPALQDKRDALNTERGGEANRGSPA